MEKLNLIAEIGAFANREPERPQAICIPLIRQPKPDRKCCCCAKSVTIKDILPVRTGYPFPSIGNTFKVEIDMDYLPGKAGVCDCSYEWWEWSDQETPFNKEVGTWKDLHVSHPDRFPPWPPRPVPCPLGGSLSALDADTPTISLLGLERDGVNYKRILKFQIVLRSCPDCPCAGGAVVATAEQTLEVIDGVPQEPRFVVTHVP
jgi:hypothetical protein